MGGWASLVAAATSPDGYRALVLEGSSTGTLGAPEGNPSFPRNLLLVFSRFDEFSELMWGVAVPADIVATDKLRALFGTAEPVAPGRIYGDLGAGTARKLAMPPVTHPGDHLSTEAIGAAVEWLQLTLDQPSPLAPLQQTWYWKEAATLAGLAGIVWLLFILPGALAATAPFAGAITAAPAAIEQPRLLRAAGGAVAAMVPVLAFFPLQAVANLVFPATPLFPQQITNGVLLWAWGSALIGLVPAIVACRRARVGPAELGLPLSRSAITRGAALALATCGTLYLVVLAAEFLFTVDFRFWVVALKRMSADQFVIFLIYLPLFTLFFLALGFSLHAGEPRGEPLRRHLARNGALLSAGFVLLLIVQYAPLLSGGTLAIASQPLLTIVAFQFVPLMLLIGLLSTWCFRLTNNLYTGAFINALFVTWYVVAGTATQAIPLWH